MGEIAKKDVQLLKEALEGISQALLVIDSELNITYANSRMVELFNLPHAIVDHGASVEQLHHYIASTGEYGSGDVEQHVRYRQKPILERLTYQLDRKRKDGTYISISGNPLLSGGYVFTFTDITYQKKYEEMLEMEVLNRTEKLKRVNSDLQRMADFDPLLNIWNRRKFFEFVHSCIQCEISPPVVMMIDVDNFKEVNDKFGHQNGDLALKTICGCLRDCLRPNDVLARFGGEEFVIFSPEITVIDAELMAKEMLKQVSATRIPDVELYCTVSIGITVCHEALLQIDCALNRADAALYDAKRKGRNCFVFR